MIIKKVLSFLDIVILPFTFFSSLLMKYIRKAGVENMPLSKKIFNKIGVFPILDFYYEPLFNPSSLHKPLNLDRSLPGIDLNINGQLDLINKFNYSKELLEFPELKRHELEFYYNNPTFGPGDSELLYGIIRHCKPTKIIEIGSGNSTLMAINATKKNVTENNKYSCEHICIEPYEMPWLEKTNIKLIRERVETLGNAIFTELSKNDILFIDSSHVIRPQGDVLCEYLEILPVLNKGVLIHIHDIFTPKDYPEEWINNYVRLWNEQYLLEAFLSFNKNFKVLVSLNYLKHNHFDILKSRMPVLNKYPGSEPGSFWIQKI